MYPPSSGQDLTADQARELDDTFLASDPFAYFRSRIASLLTWAERAPANDEHLAEAPDDSVRAAFNRYLQRPAADGPFRDLDVAAQVAADALAVRHHAAEALLRLACARLAPVEPSDPHPCLWADVATGPNQINDVLARLHESAAADDAAARFIRAIVPEGDRQRVLASEELVAAVNVYGEWLGYAGELLGPDQEIDLHGAHNKVKHGLAVRARSDVRLTLTSTPPAADGSVSLGALTGPDAVDVFDHPVLELLARPRVDGHRQGLEVTQLRLNTAAVLADAHMLAMTHGAFFHIAAAEHFAGRTDLPEHVTLPLFPGYLMGGPLPKHIDAKAPLGMRFQLTTPPGGGAPARETGIGFRTRFHPVEIDYDSRMTGTVVDD